MSEEQKTENQSKFSAILKKGVEILSTIPVAIPVHISKSKSMNQRLVDIKAFSFEQQAALYAQQNGLESYEESLDFDEDNDPLSDIETPEEYAAVQAMNYGVVNKPSVERIAELGAKYAPKASPAPSEPPTDASS